MSTIDLVMTASQERAVEHAVLKIFKSNKIGPTYRLRKLSVSMCGERAVEVYMEMDNGKPGTIGFEYPSSFQVFVGPKGGYTTYVRRRGRDAVRNCGRYALTYARINYGYETD